MDFYESRLNARGCPNQQSATQSASARTGRRHTRPQRGSHSCWVLWGPSRKCSAACPGFGISCRGLLHQSWLADLECREVRQPHPTNLPAGGTGIQEYRACPCWALTAQRPEQGHQERGYSLLLLSQQCRSFQILHPSCWFLVYQQSQSTHVLLFYGSSLWPLFIVMLP